MAGTLNNADNPLKTAIVRKINSEIDVNLITGVTEAPIVTQDRPLNGFDEPYIYVRVESSNEIDTTKDRAARKYFVILDVIVRSTANDAATQTRDDIVAEMESIFSVPVSDYVVVPEYTNYIQEVEDIFSTTLETDGATYHRAIVTLSFRLFFNGDRRLALPVQRPLYSFSGFSLSPVGTRIERFDSGSIIGASSYSSPNNGWTFDSVAYSLATGSDGTLVDRTVTLTSTDNNVNIVSDITYTQDSQPNQVLNATTNFGRIISTRFGAITPATAGTQPTLTDNTVANTGLRNLGAWQDERRFIQFDRQNPRNFTYTFNANAGEYDYFIYDANQGAIDRIINIAAGVEENIISLYDSIVVGNYMIYIRKRPLSFTARYTMRIE